MKLSQKKKCTGCKALGLDRGFSTCSLGYRQDVLTKWMGLNISFKPIEPCLKPKTNMEYIIATDAKYQSN